MKKLVFLSLCVFFSCAAHQQVQERPVDQTSLLTWLTQRGLETKSLQITSRQVKAESIQAFPERVQFKTRKPAGELELWRVALRDELSAWLISQKHPEGACVSVDVTPEADLIALDIQIVCR